MTTSREAPTHPCDAETEITGSPDRAAVSAADPAGDSIYLRDGRGGSALTVCGPAQLNCWSTTQTVPGAGFAQGSAQFHTKKNDQSLEEA